MFNIESKNLYQHPGFTKVKPKGKIYVYEPRMLHDNGRIIAVNWGRCTLVETIKPEQEVNVVYPDTPVRYELIRAHYQTGNYRSKNKNNIKTPKKLENKADWTLCPTLRYFLDNSNTVNKKGIAPYPSVYDHYSVLSKYTHPFRFGCALRGVNPFVPESLRLKYTDLNLLHFGNFNYLPTAVLRQPVHPEILSRWENFLSEKGYKYHRCN